MTRKKVTPFRTPRSVPDAPARLPDPLSEPTDLTDAPGPAELAGVRPQASIKRVAAMLAYSDRYIRELCARGELETNGRKGRGLRIFLDSVAAYQRRNRKAS